MGHRQHLNYCDVILRVAYFDIRVVLVAVILLIKWKRYYKGVSICHDIYI